MTLTACLFALLPWFGLPKPSATLTVSDTTTSYLRSEAGRVAVDLDTRPLLETGLDFRRASLGISYGPRLTLRDVNHSDERAPYVLHDARTNFAYTGHRLRLRASYGLFIGRQLFSNLTQGSAAATADDPAAPPPTSARVDLLPSVRSLRVLNQQAQASATYDWTPRWQSSLLTSYRISGGRDPAAQLLQPRLRDVTLGSELGYMLTRRHHLLGYTSGDRILLSNGYQHWLYGASAGWTARWRRTTQTYLSVGTAWQHTRTPDGDVQTRARPLSAAQISHQAGRGWVHTTLQAGAGVSPRINTLTGQLQLATQGNATVMLRRDLTNFSLTADASQTVPKDAPLASRVIGGGLIVTQGLTTWLNVLASARLQNQKISGYSLSLPLQWVLSASVQVHSRMQRF